MKHAAHCLAESRSTNPLSGNSGRYFAVRNSASAKELSSLTRTRVGWLDAEPMQHGQNCCCLQSCAVVAMQHWAHRLGVHPFGERCSPSQVSRVLGTVGVMHLEADDLAAVEVQDQVEVEPASLDLCRQERHVPAPD